MYVPGHRGVVANEYADAVAKAYTNDEVDGDITRRVAAAVRTRPCVYEEGEAPGLCMRTVYAAALRGAQNWAVRQMRSTATHGILAGADESNVWSEVVAHTGHARAPKRRGDKGQTGEHDTEEQYKRMTRSTYTAVDGDGGTCGVASGYRIGRHTLAEHSCTWHRHLMCVGGCGTCADLEHVTTGQCKAMAGLNVYCTNVTNCLDALAKRLPKPEKPSTTAPMRNWMCPARTTVLQAKRAIAAKMEETVRQEDWRALRTVIAGVLPEPIALQTLSQRERRRAAERVSEAVYELQRVVHAALLGRWEATSEWRRAADAARAEDAQWCKLADEAEAEEAARHARMQA